MTTNQVKQIVFLIVIIIAFFSCDKTRNERKTEKILVELTDKFPQLPKGKGKQTDFYIHTRTVEIKEFQIQLWSTPNYIKDKQEILVFINPNGKYYAVPFFSNTYRDYWNFDHDVPIPNVGRVNSTFEAELQKACNLMNYNDTLWYGSKGLLNELLFSVLQCKSLEECDSSKLINVCMTTNNDIPEENLDSCKLRINHNYSDIINRMKENRIGNWNAAYLDENNNRVYLFHEVFRNRKMYFTIKTYRQDCVDHLFSL